MKWDVRVVELGWMANAAEHESILRGFTNDGWQLVAVSSFATAARAYLIRPIETK